METKEKATDFPMAEAAEVRVKPEVGMIVVETKVGVQEFAMEAGLCEMPTELWSLRSVPGIEHGLAVQGQPESCAVEPRGSY